MSKSIGKGNTKLRKALDNARRKFGSFDEDHIVRLLPLVGYMNGDEIDLDVQVGFYQQAVRTSDGRFESHDYTYARVLGLKEEEEPQIYKAPTSEEHKQRWPAEWAEYQTSVGGDKLSNEENEIREEAARLLRSGRLLTQDDRNRLAAWLESSDAPGQR